ncbi:preprotein translocase subunit YajC [Brevibacterium spongiae]|uniref:Preprotein translocase subunit YajC n=1 Tax=Brevibacterium spongiae TaxID=2909672 RepID=A0ABY5SIZ6_9MICO|nr:preprotein translocase subunit YajC [Brevibacterium spongiae]UVI34527.1 preprotein translocase subunit YajC [Brevibacterium spongiae]
MGDLLIPLALAALLIFFLFNSRRKQKARAEQIKTGLVPGATVMTTFGVFGTVLSIDEENNQVTIESGPGTVLRVHRQAIGQIDNPEAAVAAAPADAPAADSPADVDADEQDEKPAITDAELDAMNARKRAEQDTDADDSVVADSDDSTTGGSVAAESDVSNTAEDQDTEVTDSEAVDSAEAEDPADADVDSSDSDSDKKN